MAEIRFGEERTGITKVGGRSIHQFWSLLSPHFRDVLLAPQRRTDDGGVAWTWRESLEKKPINAADLAGVRKRLERANESFAENPVNPLMSEDRGGTSSQALIDQVAVKVKAMAEALAAKSDAALTDFVCRTETGIMVHSWGVASAAQVIYPESLETGISGTVLSGGKPLDGYEVLVENAQGLSVARTRSDSAGQFRFSKINQGRYRVRVISGRVKFPPKGSMITVERGAVARLEMRSLADSEGQDEQATDETSGSDTNGSAGSKDPNSEERNRGRGGIGRIAVLLVLLMLLVGGAVWAWRTWSNRSNADQQVVVRGSTMAPEDFSAGDKKASTPGHSAGDGAGLGAMVDAVGNRTHSAGSASGQSVDRLAKASTMDRGDLPSTIGSRVEVQSGVANKAGMVRENSNEFANPSAALDETPGGESASDVPDSARISGGDSADSTTTKPKHLRVGGLSGQESGSRPGAHQGPAMGDGVGDDQKRLPGENGPESAGSFARTKKKGAGTEPGALASNASAPNGGELDGINAPAGLASEDMTADEGGAGTPSLGSPKEKGPISKVSVIKKSPPKEKSQSGKKSRSDESESVPDQTTTSVSKGATGKVKTGTKAATATSGLDSKRAPEKSAAEAGDDSPPEGSERTDSKVGVSDASRPKKVEAGAQKSEREEINPSSAKDVRMSGIPVKKSPAEKLPARPGRPAHSGVAQLPTESSIDEPSQIANEEAVGGSGAKYVNFEVEAVRWTVRLARDAIVPTLPVKVGDADHTESVREQMIAERRARIPATIQQQATRSGFVFMLPELPAGGTFYWRDVKDSVKRTVDGGTAEIMWRREGSARAGVSVLMAPDGREAVRLTVNDEGNIAMKVMAGIRASLSLGVTRVVADEQSMEAIKGEARFFWQVNRVGRKTQESKAERPDYFINFPLDKSKALRMEVALTDQISGWSIVSNIAIRNAGP